MPIRITKGFASEHTLLRVDGRLESGDVCALREACRSVSDPLALDVSNLWSVDSDGKSALLEILAGGAEIRGASEYIELLLRKSK
jgi:hypothetical protein